MLRTVTFILGIMLILTTATFSQNLISVGSGYSENFDGMSTATNSALPSNWRADKTTTVRTLGTWTGAGTVTEQVAGASMSTSATYGIYNLTNGTANSLGGLSTSNAALKTVNIYTWLQNSGSSSITSLTMSYDVVKFRNGSNASGFTVQMYYSTDGSTWTSGGTDFTASFSADANNSGSASIPISTTSISSKTISGFTLAQNDNLYLCWSYSVTAGSTTSNAQALGIDNFTIPNEGLPVELSSFELLQKDGMVSLQWTTASEVNSHRFEIERRSNTFEEFSTIGTVAAAGYSNTNKEYQFIDQNKKPGYYEYRLKQIDNDGTYKHYQILNTKLGSPSSLKMSRNYPNPFNPSTKIQFEVADPTFVTLDIYNVLGMKVKTLYNQIATAGFHEVEFSANGLESGVYYYTINANGYQETKKMMFLK